MAIPMPRLYKIAHCWRSTTSTPSWPLTPLAFVSSA